MKIQAIVHKAEEDGYWAEVPSIPGCATQGETIEELCSNLREALEGCLSVPIDSAYPSAFAADSRPAFEVASIKVDKSETGVDRVKNVNGSLILINVSLRRIIGLAYGFEEGQDYRLVAPEWIDNSDYDISGQISARDLARGFPADVPAPA